MYNNIPLKDFGRNIIKEKLILISRNDKGYEN
jgi:hypothetical protein